MTRDDLRGIIEGISDEQLKAILNIHSKDIGKVKGNLDEVQAELEAANTKISEYETEIKGLKDSLEDSEAVKAKLNELEKDIAARKEADEKAALENSFKDRFSAVCGEAKFLNDFTKDGVFAEFKTALTDEANKSKSDADIYKAITEGKDNIFIPAEGIPGVAGKTDPNGVLGTDADVREIMGLPPIKE